MAGRGAQRLSSSKSRLASRYEFYRDKLEKTAVERDKLLETMKRNEREGKEDERIQQEELEWLEDAKNKYYQRALAAPSHDTNQIVLGREPQLPDALYEQVMAKHQEIFGTHKLRKEEYRVNLGYLETYDYHMDIWQMLYHLFQDQWKFHDFIQIVVETALKARHWMQPGLESLHIHHLCSRECNPSAASTTPAFDFSSR